MNEPTTPNTSRSATRQEIKHELQATLTARHELGPEYDEQFLDRLVEKLVAAQPRPVPPAKGTGARSDQRLALAICSLVFGIPLVAIGGGIMGPVGILVIAAMLVAINLAFAWG